MTNTSDLCAVKKVFYHSSCPDGTSSAMIVAYAFERAGVKAEFIPIFHNTPGQESIVPESGCLFVDITPHESQTEAWIPHRPIVLDHHVTAKGTTEALGGVYRTNDAHCGAVLAYENVYVPLMGENIGWREFARRSMIRDTWKESDPEWGDACAQACALTFYGAEDMIEKSRRGGFLFTELLEFGRMLRLREEKTARKYAKSAWNIDMILRGHALKLSVFNCTDKMQSDTGNLLLKEGADLAIGTFFTMEDGELIHCVSLRSTGKVSAADIAKGLGGGGHDRAAGFRIPASEAAGPVQVCHAVQLALYKLASKIFPG